MDENHDDLSLLEKLSNNILYKIFYYICEEYNFDYDVEDIYNIINLSYCSKRLNIVVENYKCIYGMRDMRELKINKNIGGHLLYIHGKKQNTLFDVRRVKTLEEANCNDIMNRPRKGATCGRDYVHYISNIPTKHITYEMKINISNTMPDLKKIYFYDFYGTIKALPEETKELHIYNNIRDNMIDRMIVFETATCNINNLTALEIYGYVNEQFIDELCNLTNLISLTLSGLINNIIKIFPPNLKTLTMGRYNNIGLDDAIKDLALTELDLNRYTYHIRFFPKTLKKLSLKSYNIEIENLPKGLVYLKLGDYNHAGFGNILKSLDNLKYLHLYNYSHKITVLPCNIEELCLENYNIYDICDLFWNMNRLRHLSLAKYTHQITYLPPYLLHLNFYRYNIEGFDTIFSNLKNLEKIIIPMYTHTITKLPVSLRSINLGKYEHDGLRDILLTLPYLHTARCYSRNFLERLP